MTEASKDTGTLRYVPPLTIRAGEIQFIEACHPPLVAGDYQVEMHQTIKDSADSPVPYNADPYESKLRFTVDAARFGLKPTDIHSVYPPANEEGAFDNALPHVVFTRRTLPWERTLDGRPPELGKAFPPWMALLLLQEDELVKRDTQAKPTGQRYAPQALPVLENETSKDCLLFPRHEDGRPSDEILAPALGQDQWDKARRDRYAKASCLALDLPLKLFRAIAPRREDLSYLAHVRQVDTGDKEVLGINDKGWFSLVIGNRMPQAKQRHQVFLVSLEGHQELLPKEQDEAKDLDPAKRVRLAVLGSWSFACGESNGFKARMKALNLDRNSERPKAAAKREDAWLGLPFGDFDDKGKAAADVVNGAYARGYAVFGHAMRHGERMVSWYRGPLVPLNYDKPEQIQELVTCADELLRYDPDTGMLEVTYAAAWQLGRLLALQNHGFALALDRVRRRMRERAERMLHERQLRERHDWLGMEEGALIEDCLMDHLANGAGDSLMDAVSAGEGVCGPRPPSTSPGAATAEPSTEKPETVDAAAREIRRDDLGDSLADVATWLGRLLLLYGVPFHYLVPQQGMLPPASLRLFFLDPIWIQCLVQGACSIGNTGYGDTLVDRVMNEVVVPTQPTAQATGTAAAGVRDGLRKEREGVKPHKTDRKLHWPLTGFLLRSPVVTGWKGLEIKAYRGTAVPVDPLRIEQLTEDVMLGLFNGVIERLVIRQPQEGLHFGLEVDGEGRYGKRLRDMGFIDPKRAGKPLDPEIELALQGDGLMRSQSADGPAGVIEIAALAEAMKVQLEDRGQLRKGRFTSAEFAIEMLEAAGEFTYCVTGKDHS